MTNSTSGNELKLFSCRVFLFTKGDGSEESETVFKYYLSICFILFCFDLKKKRKRGGLPNLSLHLSYTFQSISTDDIKKHKFK